MVLLDWSIRLRTDSDLAHWMDAAADAAAPGVRAFGIVRYTNPAVSLHAWRHMPSGHYLILTSGRPRSEATRWFEANVRPEDAYVTSAGSGAFRPEQWDECADYAWEARDEEQQRPPADAVSADTWEVPPPPPAEWMVHCDTAEDLTASLAAISAFNASVRTRDDPVETGASEKRGRAASCLPLRVTKVVRHSNGTKRFPAGVWLVTENADAGSVTALWWKKQFQYTGRGVATDTASCHTIRRSKATLWFASAAGVDTDPANESLDAVVPSTFDAAAVFAAAEKMSGINLKRKRVVPAPQ